MILEGINIQEEIMEKCYEYFDCQQVECIVFQNKTEQACWETEKTLCFFQPLTAIIKENDQTKKCDFCLYKMSVLDNK